MTKKLLLLSVMALSLLVSGCQSNSSGWPIIWGMHNGTPVQKQQPESKGVYDTNLFTPLPPEK